jgi:primosomal protein N'
LPPQASFDINKNTNQKINNRIFAIQGDDADRISSWRSLIRQEFANKRSVAIYVPTIEDSKLLFSALEKGIEGYIFCLNNNLSSKKFASTWKNISETDHPIVVISTGSFSLLPRIDIKTIIIERENGRGWISQKSPYLDIRTAIITIAKLNNQTIYLADSMLRIETLNEVEKETIEAEVAEKIIRQELGDEIANKVVEKKITKTKLRTLVPDKKIYDAIIDKLSKSKALKLSTYTQIKEGNVKK